MLARRVFRTRRYGTGLAANDMRDMEKQWLGLTEAQKRELEERSHRIGIDALFKRCAFWEHYTSKLGNETYLKASYMDSQLFQSALESWTIISQNERASMANEYRRTPDILQMSLMPEEGDSDGETEESDAEHDNGLELKHDVTDGDDFAEALQNETDTNAITTRLNISELFSRSSVAEYEKGVVKGLDLLKKLRATLEITPGQESVRWLTALKKVEAQAACTQTVMGVVGATGAGKSSVINAMLDEERLLPTNCMRACTAVVTEISYNYQNELYRAEIEFISPDDWRKELELLYQELLDSSGNICREAAVNEDSDAGVAYAKLKAVYPFMTKEDLQGASITRLMDHKNVRVLGTVRDVDSDNAPDFYQSLQRYVDSKEKSRGAPKKDVPKSMEYWPLIKVVRLYVRAPALQTGAVIVDLPGVHDSNQARAAVAQRYMKSCTGLWIVAPINRAVDDKSAKTLMGETFKRQLKIDGAYNSVTFICSKTDDISITEATEFLKLDEKLQHAYDQIHDLIKVRKGIEAQVDEHKKLHKDIASAVDKADEEVEIWDDLLQRCQAGKTVYPPKPKKRKKTPSPKARKRPRYAEPDSDDDFIATSEDESHGSDVAQSDDEDEESREPVTEEQALAKVEELRSTKKEGRRRRIEIEKVLKDLRQQITANKAEQETSDAIISAECIAGRTIIQERLSNRILQLGSKSLTKNWLRKRMPRILILKKRSETTTKWLPRYQFFVSLRVAIRNSWGASRKTSLFLASLLSRPQKYLPCKCTALS